MLDIKKILGGLTAPPKPPAGRVPRYARHTIPQLYNSHPLYGKILDPPLDSRQGQCELTNDSRQGQCELTNDSRPGQCELTNDSRPGQCELTNDSRPGQSELTQDKGNVS